MKTDPFTTVFKGLWEVLESYKPFRELVKESNRIKFTGHDRDPEKTNLSESDLPEVRIVPVTLSVQMVRATNTVTATQTFEIQVSTGDKRLHHLLFPVKWAVLRAMTDWRVKMSVLVWNGKKFVNLTRPTEVGEGVSDYDLNRNIKGWSAVFSGEIRMFWSETDMKNEEL